MSRSNLELPKELVAVLSCINCVWSFVRHANGYRFKLFRKDKRNSSFTQNDVHGKGGSRGKRKMESFIAKKADTKLAEKQGTL